MTVLFIIILEAWDKKTQVWLAVRRVRMLVGGALKPLLGRRVARQ